MLIDWYKLNTEEITLDDKFISLQKDIDQAKAAVDASNNNLWNFRGCVGIELSKWSEDNQKFESLTSVHNMNKNRLQNLQEELKELIDKPYRHQDKPLFKINYALSNKLYFRRK